MLSSNSFIMDEYTHFLLLEWNRLGSNVTMILYNICLCLLCMTVEFTYLHDYTLIIQLEDCHLA